MTDLVNILGQPQGTQSFDHIRIAIVRCRFVAGLVEQARHPLRVVDVHLAAVGFDEVFPGHSRTFACVEGETFAFAFRLIFVSWFRRGA